MHKLKSILLIDDDPICTWLNQSLLEDIKICDQIVCYSDGQSALNYLKQLCGDTTNPKPDLPDLILLDLNMPIIDGFEFLEAVNELPTDPIRLSERVVILTTSLHQKDLEKAKSFSIRAYIIKPLNPDKISTIFKEMLLSSDKLSPSLHNGADATATELDRSRHDRQNKDTALENTQVKDYD